MAANILKHSGANYTEIKQTPDRQEHPYGHGGQLIVIKGMIYGLKGRIVTYLMSTYTSVPIKHVFLKTF